MLKVDLGTWRYLVDTLPLTMPMVEAPMFAYTLLMILLSISLAVNPIVPLMVAPPVTLMELILVM